MKTSDFDYDLPKGLIAQHPLPQRDASRLFVVKRETGDFEHRHFAELAEYLSPGDLLVLNDTKVIPAKLVGRKKTGGAVQGLLLNPVGADSFSMLFKGKLRPGDKVYFKGKTLVAQLIEKDPEGVWKVRFEQDNPLEVIEHIGRAPLPPYIEREKVGDIFISEDIEKYQTVFARKRGAIAAPTAGLHFTEDILSALRQKGVAVHFVTLHVGLGTFKPVETERVEGHRMHSERYEVDSRTLTAIKKAKSEKRKVFAVGSTAARTLETVARDEEKLSGFTDLFIYPGFEFRFVDALITNFHLPKSTLLMLVCAFGGKQLIMEAYEEAVKLRYRFYSYGDAMLLL
jgi:S-adenosylmethionine:tRNA ribosyltransferase-isomerase